MWNVNRSPIKSDRVCSPRTLKGQRTNGFGTQKAPRRTAPSPTIVTATEDGHLSFEAKNREAVRIRVSGIIENGANNTKPSPVSSRGGSGRASGAGGILV